MGSPLFNGAGCAWKPSKWHRVSLKLKRRHKVASWEVRTEVSQAAVSVLTPYRVQGRLNRNYIRRLLGRMRYHMLPKSKALKGDSTEIRTEREENVLWTFLVTGQLAGLEKQR